TDGFDLEEKQSEDDEEPHSTSPYISWQREDVKNNITGAIYKARVDNSHPLAFGYSDTYFSLKRGNTAYALMDSGNVVYLEDSGDPLSGFAGSEARKNISNTLVFGVQKHGKGNIVYMVDDPLFRGFWQNGKLFFVNALFMVR
ncbi:zinc carboxypeptidase, partial [Sinomicrobium sp. FJxs]|nr:zinc carboxypeptidase [Sinomicrobium weinanense]